jgi:hypothetical protein
VRELESTVRWPNQIVLNQAGTGVARVPQEAAERVGGEALAKDRGGLECLLINRIQLVDPRQNQTLNRPGKRPRGRLLRDAQQLLQEQWVTLRTLDTIHGQPVHRLH